jgi:sugar (pentulose or hexulose) kinase
MTCVIGLDIGTTSTIGILIRMPSERLALASRSVTLTHRHAGWAEEDPQQWWRNVCEIVPELLQQAGVQASEVQAVGVSGMVPAVVLLGADGQLLRPSIQQSDGRCAQEVQALRAAFDEAAFTRRTGNVSACSVPHALKETWSRLTGLVACPTAAVGSPGRPEVLQGCVLLRSTALHDRQATVAA